jgi:mono/diheme cytochrome c family protein
MSRRPTPLTALSFAILLFAVPPAANAQGPQPEDGGPPPFADSNFEKQIDQGSRDYALHCSACHGPRGEGDGLLAAKLDPVPARLADPGLLVTRSDDDLYRAIERGIPGSGDSEGMAAWGDTLAPEQIHALVAFLRKLQSEARRPDDGSSTDSIPSSPTR